MSRINGSKSDKLESILTNPKDSNGGQAPVVLNLDYSFAIVSFHKPGDRPALHCATKIAWQIIRPDMKGFLEFCRKNPTTFDDLHWTSDSGISTGLKCKNVPGVHANTYIYVFSAHAQHSNGVNYIDIAKSRGLSAREAEVLSQMAKGLGNREIARVLNISYHTVRAHLRSIFNTLNVDNRIEALIEINRPASSRQNGTDITATKGADPNVQ